jgi:hypothetical protein
LAWIGEQSARSPDGGWYVVRVIEGTELKLKPVEVVRGWAFE